MRLRITVNNTPYDVEVDVLEDREGALHGPHAPQAISLNPQPARQKVTASAAPHKPVVAAPAPTPAAVGNVEGPSLPSPIPGTIVEIETEVGAEVKLGDAVIVIDAMKMHTQITANQDGRVKAILVKPGEVVQMGQALLIWE